MKLRFLRIAEMGRCSLDLAALYWLTIPGAPTAFPEKGKPRLQPLVILQLLWTRHCARANPSPPISFSISPRPLAISRLRELPASVPTPDISACSVVYTSGARNGNHGTCAALEG